MLVNQLSAFIENKRGRVHNFTEVLAQNGIDLLTLSIADTRDYGILRAITRDNDRAAAALRAAGFTVSITQLIGIELGDHPGSLANILSIFDSQDISIEYLYSYARTSGQTAIILFKVEDPQRALKILEANGIVPIDKIPER